MQVDFFISYQDLKPETQARIHSELMQRIRDEKEGDLSPDEEFEKISLLADEMLKDLEISAYLEHE